MLPLWLFPAIGGTLGAISGGVAERQEAQEQQRQIAEQRKQIFQSANNIRALEAKEGAAMQYAYNWASSMVNKYRRNPEAIASVTQGLSTQLGQSSQQRSALRTTAQQLLAQRPASSSDSWVKGAWMRGALKGFASGMGAGIQGTSALADAGVPTGWWFSPKAKD